MLFLKRILTALVLFVVMTFVLFMAGMMIGGAVAGAMATNAEGPPPPGMSIQDSYNHGYQLGRRAGLEFGRKYGRFVLLGCVGVSAAGSLALCFGGAFPWCRRREV